MATVLILGASSDMAIAIAKKFASEKYNIQLAARNIDQMKPLQSDISIRYDVACTIHPFNALAFEAHAAFFQLLDPKPEITICVFGYLGENEKARLSWKEAETIIHTNYTGAVSILNIAARYYEENKRGTIVGI